jgi:signal transduction histidine kinase/response regulator RpfG family c-di-GMP phosphodiesterase
MINIFENITDNFCHTFLNLVHKDDYEKENNLCQNFFLHNTNDESTFRMFNSQFKEYRWMINKRTVIHGKISISYMFTLQDIHNQKLIETQMRNETLNAERAYNHKSIFLANMSHEIRTPLNGIIGMLTLLEDTELRNDQIDYISMVKECSFNLMTIINDILDYSKLEVGKITLDEKPMNLRDCIESTNDIIVSKIYEKSLEYTYHINSDIPINIIGDSNRIKQILLNLISNSIKFTDKGTIFLNIEKISYNDFLLLNQLHNNDYNSKKTNSTKYISSDNDFIYLRFDITDTGCGIDKDDKDKLFKSFTQIDNHLTSKSYQGTGLGLVIGKELVELMSGYIWLDWSEVNKGSRFSFIIKTSISNEMCSEQEKCSDVLSGANVLVVDDNLYNRISLTGLISKWGMKAHAFSNAEEALCFTKLTPFDIGLIDICMPKMDGHTFARKLHEQKEYENDKLPLIALSSIGDKRPPTGSLFKKHLVKPVKESKLREVCIDLLQKRKNNHIEQSSSSDDIKVSNNEIIQTEIQKNLRILLAEDIYINQRVIVSFLKKIGYNNVEVVENGKQCLDLVRTLDFDIILLDIRMPIMDGDVVLQEIKKLYSKETTRKIPFIVAVTAYCLREDREKYLNMGFDDYIAKPVTIPELKRCINIFLDLSLYN